MLLELRAENYAVIDQAVAEFGPGLNLLTGETGAGKSILIDALALLLGGKASSDVVRHGAEKAVLGCVFEIDAGGGGDSGGERDRCGGFGRDSAAAGDCCGSGKGRVFVNNQPATVAVLRQLAPELALVHAQGETLGSFDQAQQRMLLDRFGGISSAKGGRGVCGVEGVRRSGWRSCRRRAGPAADGGPVAISGEGDCRCGGIAADGRRRAAGGGEARAGERGEAVYGGDERARIAV